MKDRVVSSFGEKEEAITKELQLLGLGRKEARIVTYLSTVQKAEDRKEIELVTGLRQPEVSVGLRSLERRGFVAELGLNIGIAAIAMNLYAKKDEELKRAFEKLEEARDHVERINL